MRTIFISLLLLLTSVSPVRAQSNAAIAAKNYAQELEAWNKARVAYLKSDTGWLNLAGLIWLQPGYNSIGSSDTADVILKDNRIPNHAGALWLADGKVVLLDKDSKMFKANGKPVQEQIIFPAAEGKPTTVDIGRYRFHIIKRDTKLGVRLRDLQHPAIQSFPGIERFPPDTQFRVEATLIPGGPYKTIPITNVLGQTTQQASPGTLLFTLKGKQYALQSLLEEGKLFIVFGDETNADETYGAGRFLYAAIPDASGKVLLDFNKSFNPPCAFTPFATCPLPPKENQLPLAIKAGEKDLGHH
jgi:uncharacterized protein (DUF1684 family)